jgi:hypothetical protein
MAGQRTNNDCAAGEVPLVATSFDDAGVQDDFVHLGCYVDVPSELTVAENHAREITIKGDGFVRLTAPGEGLFRFDCPYPGRLFALADDHWALTDGAGNWTGTMEHDGLLSPPRCFLARTDDVRRFEVVLGGRGYLLYHEGQPCDRFAEFVLADGETCGFVPISDATGCSADTVNVGVDGSLALTDLDSCTIRVWPGAFH